MDMYDVAFTEVGAVCPLHLKGGLGRSGWRGRPAKVGWEWRGVAGGQESGRETNEREGEALSPCGCPPVIAD